MSFSHHVMEWSRNQFCIEDYRFVTASQIYAHKYPKLMLNLVICGSSKGVPRKPGSLRLNSFAVTMRATKEPSLATNCH